MDCGPRAKLVVDSAGKDELAVKATGLCGLCVEELELPVDNR